MNTVLSLQSGLTHLIHRVEDVVLGRRIHEVELEQILHPQALEEKHHIGEVGALYLGHGGGQQLLPVLALRVEAVALARPGTTGAPRSLVGVRLRHREDLQGVHT